MKQGIGISPLQKQKGSRG